MKKIRSCKARQGGYSLVELGIVLLIIAVILAVVIGKSYFAKSSANAQTEESTIVSILGATPNFKGSFGTPGTYGTAGTSLVPTLITGKVVPPSYSTTATTITNSWGGAISLVSTGAGYTLSDAALPDDICQSITPAINNSGGNTGALTTSINGAAFTNATTQCTGGTNTISFTSTN